MFLVESQGARILARTAARALTLIEEQARRGFALYTADEPFKWALRNILRSNGYRHWVTYPRDLEGIRYV